MVEDGKGELAPSVHISAACHPHYSFHGICLHQSTSSWDPLVTYSHTPALR